MESLPDRLPLVIGVTGHRDLRDQDVAKIEQQVAAVIAELRRDYLGSEGETPIIVLSALAEGADRLVARVAIAHGAHLIAPLPMPLDEYRRDFEPGLKAGNMAEFDALFAQAIAAPVMPLHATSLEALRTDGKKRAEQYRAVGIFITQHCHVLLALWDGDDREMAAGGSAEVVTFKRRGIPLGVSGSARVSLDASEVGPVIDIVTPRVKETSSTDQVSVRPWGKAVIRRFRGGIARRVWRRVAEFAAHLARRDVEDERSRLSPEDRRELETWESFEALIDLTRQFNRDAAALAKKPDGPARMAQSIDYLFTDPRGRHRRRRRRQDARHGSGAALVPALRDRRHAGAGAAKPIQMGLEAAVRIRLHRVLLLRDVHPRRVRQQGVPRHLFGDFRGAGHRVSARRARAASGAISRLPGLGRGAAGRGLLEAARHRLALSRCQDGPVGPRCDGRYQSGRDDRERLSDQAAERACLGEGRVCGRSSGSTGPKARLLTGSIRSGMPLPGATGCTANSPISSDKDTATTALPKATRPLPTFSCCCRPSSSCRCCCSTPCMNGTASTSSMRSSSSSACCRERQRRGPDMRSGSP